VRTRLVVVPLVLLALVASACATHVPPIGLDARPFSPDPDERRLWAQAERDAAAILRRVRTYDDPVLAAYLGRLGERLTPEAARAAGAPALRFSVLRDPTLSAFALPDGHVFVHTGLLAAVDGEAQLALILAREIAHVVRRHALAATRDGLVEAARYEGASVLSPAAAAILGASAPVATLAAIAGYRAGEEREADADGLASLARGGWDVRRAVGVHDVLSRDAGDRGALEVFLLGTPAHRRRTEALRELARSAPAGGFGTSDEFETLRLSVSRDNAMEDARVGRFVLARRQLDRVLVAGPTDVTALVYDGDLHRLVAQRTAAPQRDGELDAALRAYARAAAADPARADVHRQLGLLYYQLGDLSRARAELQAYLALAPGAADGPRIAEYARELEH
jgi:predicted Zn-dependent protease